MNTSLYTYPNNKFFRVCQITRSWGIFLDVSLNVCLKSKMKIKKLKILNKQNETVI